MENKFNLDFDVYSEAEVFCPFCSDAMVHLKIKTVLRKREVFIEWNCCNLHYEYKLPEHICESRMKAFYMPGILNDEDRKNFEEIPQHIIKVKNDIIELLKITMPIYEQIMEWRKQTTSL
jgi:hypothetical protein